MNGRGTRRATRLESESPVVPLTHVSQHQRWPCLSGHWSGHTANQLMALRRKSLRTSVMVSRLSNAQKCDVVRTHVFNIPPMNAVSHGINCLLWREQCYDFGYSAL
jgi:hypothetical protein